MSMRKIRWIVLTGLFFSFSAFSDWEGNFDVVATGPKSIQKVSGLMRMKKDKVRLDTTTPAVASTLVNLTTHKAWTLLTAQKMSMEVNLSQIEPYTPLCPAHEIESCLKKKNFKKVGSEKIENHMCSIYESEIQKNEKKITVKLWRPEDLKEVPALKSVVMDDSGSKTETLFSNVKMVAQADRYFTVPKDYRAMGNPQDLLKGLGFKMPAGIKIPGQ